MMKRSWIRAFVGAILAFLAGGAAPLAPDMISQALRLTNSPGSSYISMGVLALVTLVTGVSAWLLRSWWSALVVPALFFAGYMLGALLGLRVMGSPYDANYLALAADVFAVIFFTPLLVIALIVTAVSKRASRPGRAASM
ncbi:MAG TPA: hypothetical protein VF808_05545 [Ktedonobacterales bacterium]